MADITYHDREPMLPPRRPRVVAMDDFAPPQREGPGPDDLGVMSGEAVLQSYEAAAESLTLMGDEVKQRVHNLMASLREAYDSMRLLDEAAKSIRDKGKLAQMQVEEMSALAKDIRDTVTEFKRKVGELHT